MPEVRRCQWNPDTAGGILEEAIYDRHVDFALTKSSHLGGSHHWCPSFWHSVPFTAMIFWQMLRFRAGWDLPCRADSLPTTQVTLRGRSRFLFLITLPCQSRVSKGFLIRCPGAGTRNSKMSLRYTLISVSSALGCGTSDFRNLGWTGWTCFDMFQCREIIELNN